MSTNSTLEQIIAQAVSAAVASALAAVDLSTETEPAKAEQPKADVRYRTKAQIAKGHAAEQEIYARYRATTGKGFKAMTAKNQAACKAEIKAVWSELKGACKSKRV